jgi:Fe-S-cluster containining protein
VNATQIVSRESGSEERIDVRLEELENSLAGGLRFNNRLGVMNQQELQDQRALLYSTVELLLSKGVIHLDQLESRKQELMQSLLETKPISPKVYMVEAPDKYSIREAPVIDCSKRYSLCHGACCKLWFSLTVQDLDERIVKWNCAQPYGIAQGSDGRCVHQDRESLKCTVYEHRPHICRTYDCSSDKRIWEDFEKYIPNPMLGNPNWPRAATESRPALAGPALVSGVHNQPSVGSDSRSGCSADREAPDHI